MSIAPNMQVNPTLPSIYSNPGCFAQGRLGNLRYESHHGGIPKAARSKARSIRQWIEKIIHRIRSFGISSKARTSRWDRYGRRQVNTSVTALLKAAGPRPDHRVDSNVDSNMDPNRLDLAAMKLDRLLDCSRKRYGDAYVKICGDALEKQLASLDAGTLMALCDVGVFSTPASRNALLSRVGEIRQKSAGKIIDCLIAKLREERGKRCIAEQERVGGMLLDELEMVLPLRQRDPAKVLSSLPRLADYVHNPEKNKLVWQVGADIPTFLAPAVGQLSDERLARLTEGLRTRRDDMVRENRIEDDRYVALSGQVISAFDEAMRDRLNSTAMAGAKSLRNGGLDAHGSTLETRSRKVYLDISDAVKRLTGRDPLLDGGAARDRDAYFECALRDVAPDDLRRCLSTLDFSAVASLKSSLAGTGLAGTETRVAKQIGRLHEERTAAYQQEIIKVQASLGEAVMQGDRGKVTVILAELSGIVVPFGKYLAHFGQPMPMVTLPHAVKQALGLFHGKRPVEGSPAAPLAYEELRHLSSLELKNLRVAEKGLGAFGLRVDGDALVAVVAQRLRPYEDAAVAAAQNFGSKLDAPAVTAFDTVSALRDVVGSALSCLDARYSLGEPVGVLDRAMLVKHMVNALLRVPHRPDGNLARNLSRDYRSLTSELGCARDAATDALTRASDSARFALDHTAEMLCIAKDFLDQFRDELVFPGEDAARPSEDLRLALKGEFGLAYDAESLVAFDRMGIQHDLLNENILQPTSTAAKAMVDIPTVGAGSIQTITVSKQFKSDAIDRRGLSLFLSGVSSKGVWIQPSIQDRERIELDRDARLQAMERALLALNELNPGACKTLTPIMNQQFAAGYMLALAHLGTDSPLTLPDGRPVSMMQESGGLEPSGLFFHVERYPDGNYKLSFAHIYPQVDKVMCVQTGKALALQPERSHMSVTGAVKVDPAGGPVKMLSPVEFRYRLVEVEGQPG